MSKYLQQLRLALYIAVALISWSVQPAYAVGVFGFDDVAAQAKRLAAEPFAAPPLVPEFLRQLTYDQYRDIRFDSAAALWKDGGYFQVQFIHPGLYYHHAVRINTYERDGIRRAAFSTGLFSYGQNKFADNIPADLGFAGFRITYPFRNKDEYNHVLVFAGASYFRAVARNSVFGLSARGLAIDTGLPSGEEFPYFREFWLERPAKTAREMRIFALLDSQSVTGAYQFILRPGERTVIDVKAKLFGRKAVKELGIAPLTSMFFFGEERPRPPGEWRPEVHDSDGLLIQAGTGEWLWRPLANPERLQLSYFDVENPRGFGLLQRDRNFRNYEDLETRHELRPNAWIVPVGNWGKGKVKLVEIPTQNETNDNIVAYWVAAQSLSPERPLDLTYRIYFQNQDPMDTALARAIATRIARGEKEDWRRVIIDFEGKKINSLAQDAPLTALIDVMKDAQVVQQSLYKNKVTGGWRLAFQIKPVPGKPLELRAALQNGGEAVTETWSYQLAP